MSKLTDSQLVLLAAAAARPTHAVLPPPVTMTLNKAALTTVINSLIKKALIVETPASTGGAVWRELDGQRLSLVITPAGLDAIGIDTGDHQPPEQPAAADAPLARRGGGKVDAVFALLRRPEGASIADMNGVTGWQAHSIRAFLSGLRKKSTEVARTKDDAGKAIYRITGGSA